MKAKHQIKLDLSNPKDGELFFIGISSAAGVAVITQQINRFFDLRLTYYSQLLAFQKETILDRLVIFTTFEPKENKFEMSEDEDFFNLHLPSITEISKYLLIQCRGDNSVLFPKIQQADYVFISNYSMKNWMDTLKSIPEVTICFELNRTHLGKRYDYFRQLFYMN